MPKSPTPKKITIVHPRTKTEMQIEKDIYDPVKAAILEALKGSDGLSWTDLSNEVVKIAKKTMPGFKKSVAWYAISIKLDLETKGKVETFTLKGKTLTRLKK